MIRRLFVSRFFFNPTTRSMTPTEEQLRAERDSYKRIAEILEEMLILLRRGQPIRPLLPALLDAERKRLRAIGQPWNGSKPGNRATT